MLAEMDFHGGDGGGYRGGLGAIPGCEMVDVGGVR